MEVSRVEWLSFVFSAARERGCTQATYTTIDPSHITMHNDKVSIGLHLSVAYHGDTSQKVSIVVIRDWLLIQTVTNVSIKSLF